MNGKNGFVGSRAYWYVVALLVLLLAIGWTLVAAGTGLSPQALHLLIVTHAPLLLVAVIAPVLRQQLRL